MALTTKEQRQALYASPGLTFTVHTFIRADMRGAMASNVNDATATTFSLEPAVTAQIRVGDIIQAGNEDMLVTNVNIGTDQVTVQRQYAGTLYEFPISQPALYVWRDFTDHVGVQHGISAVSAIARKFERGLFRHETEVGTLYAQNNDGWWFNPTFDTGQLLGFSSFRNHWIRFYLRARRGGDAVDNVAVATILFDDYETSLDGNVSITLKGIGSLTKGESEANGARNGNERVAYTPAWYCILRALESIDEYRDVGSLKSVGLPIYWRKLLAENFGKTWALPSGTRAVSYYGKFPMFYKAGANDPFFTRHIGGPTTPGPGEWAGGPATAMCWDPQVRLGGVVTGDPLVAGRYYIARAGDIWEFDPVTSQAARRLGNLGGLVGANASQIIRRLWYNPLDPAASGNPKICGVSYQHYENFATPGGPAYVSTDERYRPATLFRWNGGATFSNSLTVTDLFPGTHFFRNGTNYAAWPNGFVPEFTLANDEAQVIGRAGAPAGGQGENVCIPFPQTVYTWQNSAQTGSARLLWFCYAHPSSSGLLAGNTAGSRGKEETLGYLGFQIEPGNLEIVGASSTAIRPAYYSVVHYDSDANDPYNPWDDGINLRHTHGQSGGIEFCGDSSGTETWATNGAIVYSSGGFVKSWNVVSSAANTLFDPSTQDAGDPHSVQVCAMAGNRGITATGAFIVFAFVDWSETGDSTVAKLIKINETKTAHTILTVSTPNHYTPLWMTLINRSTYQRLLVSWLDRDKMLSTDTPYFLSSYSPGGSGAHTIPAIKPSQTPETRGFIHAMTSNTTITDGAWALDTSGRLIKLKVNTGSDGFATSSGLVVQDRGFPPVDGEHWSGCYELGAPHGQDNTCHGISAPYWPFGDDMRGGKTDGFYVLWKLDSTMWDGIEVATWDNKTVEEALADISFGTSASWGFDIDGRGNFLWRPRLTTGAPVVRLGGGSDRSSYFSRSAGYQEIENQVEIAPYILHRGDVRVSIELLRTSTDKSTSAVDVQYRGVDKQTIALKCVRGGRVGIASFVYYVQNGVFKCHLAQTYAAGVPTATVLVHAGARKIMGPHDNTDADDRAQALAVPQGARIRLPDGQELVADDGISTVSDFMLSISLDATIGFWTPTTICYAGQPVEIDGQFARQSTDYNPTAASTEPYDTLYSSYDWQEIGSGDNWATGVYIKFSEPEDDGHDPNFRERAWLAGERIVIEVDGISAQANDSAKVVVSNPTSIKKYGKKLWEGRRGAISARRAVYLGESHIADNGRPRWVWQCRTALAPYISLFDTVTIYDPKRITTAPHTETAIVRGIRHDVQGGTTELELLGSQHD